MNTFDIHSPLFDVAAFGSIAVLLVLAVLTIRSVVRRDRAITFGKTKTDEESRRAAYEARWRNGGIPQR
ncbi:MAG: hypothetical protein EBU23_00465 [Mycobacteriaceae bacterium]|nr:hypothetical protein [Mycobacterium sp.]NBQ41092.1 hypothetical protein [Mycobacteriaceae bacterium]